MPNANVVILPIVSAPVDGSLILMFCSYRWQGLPDIKTIRSILWVRIAENQSQMQKAALVMTRIVLGCRVCCGLSNCYKFIQNTISNYKFVAS
jgi:hypothetical protein